MKKYFPTDTFFGFFCTALPVASSYLLSMLSKSLIIWSWSIFPISIPSTPKHSFRKLIFYSADTPYLFPHFAVNEGKRLGHLAVTHNPKISDLRKTDTFLTHVTCASRVDGVTEGPR